MADPLSRIATRAVYGARQLGRVAWYVGHREIMRWLAQEARRRSGETVRPRTRGAVRVPDRWRLYADMAELFRQDLTNVESGIYPLPADHDSWPTRIERSRLFFIDLPRVYQRRERGERREVVTAETRGRRPEYYLQNFHFQSGGWMTEDSAKRYDTQVEVLFNGSASAIRRQALPPLSEIFAGRDQRGLRLMDIGCGTGRFLDFVKQVWPRLPVIGIDMSEAYIAEARRYLRRRGWLRLVVGKGEAIPVGDESQDALTSIFVFHELPPDIRRAAFLEFARVLKPGGRLVIVDSLQLGDEPDYDDMLELFPQGFHEPYYASYVREDFGEIARACGLMHRRDVRAYVSKVMVFDKPA
ncbi:MAG TPA: class I SAM-dependent methyltransferase [Xanthobacteraceae bacterium]|jgi:ubiquinone/menaquinone biosynthesis C-methylase UbiE